MAVTTLDPKTALIVVDLQNGLLGSPFIHPIDKAVERSRLARCISGARVGGCTGQYRRRRRRSNRAAPSAALASTGTGVECTARQAYEQGFNVTLALDAMTDLRPEAHDYSIRNVFPRLGETGTAQDIIALLQAKRL